MKYIVNDDVVLSQPLGGPLSAHIPAFAQWARDQGYAWASRYRHVLLAACFSRWLGQQAITIRRVSAEQSARYLRSRARRAQIHRGDIAALSHFVDFLQRGGVIRPKKVAPRSPSPVEQETHAFETYLRHERMLAEATITYYVTFVREFLADRFGRGRVTFTRLCAGDVVRFVQRRASRLHPKRAKQLTTALRAFLHYVRYRGDLTQDLVAAVPCVANWSMPSIPRAIPAASVRQLLASINRQTARGRRDYAILLLLARLGLRASEVAFLELDDLNWEGGQVTVRGKRGARAALPVPADVGAAIAAYLRYGLLLVAVQRGLRLSELTALTRHDVTVGPGAHVRVIGKGRKERCTPLAKPTIVVLKGWLREPPRGDGQVLFPTARGTRLSADAVEYLVAKHRTAAAKVCPSLEHKRITTHCLRHSSAMELLQAGVDRSVIALWLGHESMDTTQIYLEATLTMKERALAKTKPLNGCRFSRYRPGDKLLGFLNGL